MKDVKLMIAVPAYAGQISLQTHHSLLDSLDKLIYQARIHTRIEYLEKESLITRGRNRLAYRFLKSDCTHLLFLDADVEFEAWDIVRLLDAAKPIIGGLYPVKEINWATVKLALQRNPNASPAELSLAAGRFAANFHPSTKTTGVPINQPCLMENIATGFMLIKREVFEALIASGNIPLRYSGYEKDDYYAFFDEGVDENNLELSEDYNFCRQAANIGIETYALLDIILNHAGAYLYQGSIPYLATLEKKP
jgi:hypothetical protein